MFSLTMSMHCYLLRRFFKMELWLIGVCHVLLLYWHMASYLDCGTKQTHDCVLKEAKRNQKIMNELSIEPPEVRGRHEFLLGEMRRSGGTFWCWCSRRLHTWTYWLPSWVSAQMEILLIRSDGETSLRNKAVENSLPQNYMYRRNQTTQLGMVQILKLP